jgi:hypothetical protein
MSRVDSISETRRLSRVPPSKAAFAFLAGDDPGGDQFPLEQISPDMLLRAVVRWCGAGYALSFGLSADGGALGVHLLAGGQRRSKWFQNVAELEDFLATIPERP